MINLNKSSQQSMMFKCDGAPNVIVSFSTLQRIKQLVVASAVKETGGILVGKNIGRDIEVTDASDAGPNARQSATYFLRDTAHCREFLAQRYNETGADYVGEWHSHVVGLKSLSAGDISTLIGILIDRDYDFVSFAVLLIIANDTQMELLVYAAEREGDEAAMLIKITQIYRGELPDCQLHGTGV